MSSEALDSPTIYGFSQSEKEITIYVTKTRMQARFLMLPNVPDFFDIELRKEAKCTDNSKRRVSIPILNEMKTCEYSIIIFLGERYVELVRQPEPWLKEQFNFDRTGGYTILGRRSLSIADGKNKRLSPLVLYKKPKNFIYESINQTHHSEINYALGLLMWLYSKPIKQGPTSKSYSIFLEQTFEEKIEQLQAGQFAVMCTGFRDLFVHASLADQRFRLRLVEAFNYAPQIPNLITYGHSTTEIWVSALNRWVLFDPWLAVMVTQDGSPIGATDISKASDDKVLKVVALMESLPRFVQNKNGQMVSSQFKPSDVHLTKIKYSPLGHTPGYKEYFKTIVTREFIVK